MIQPATINVADYIQAISQLAEVTGCTNVSARVPSKKGASDIVVELAPPRSEWQLRVELSGYNGTQLPNLYLESAASLLGHVDHSGKICINDGEGLSVDLDRPVSVVVAAVKEALATLDKAVLDHEEQPYVGLLDEMEGYWNSMSKSECTDSFIEINTTSREVYAIVDGDARKQAVFAFVDDKTTDGASYGGRARVEGKTKVCSLYLPLAKPVIPPAPGQQLPSDFLVTLGAALAPSDRQLLSRIAERKLSNKRWTYLLISQPRPHGGRATFALALRRDSRTPLFEENHPNELQPLGVIRHDTEHVRERGGANLKLADAHIAIIGCGSLGSRIAELLALSGLGRLTLVDPEKLTSDNIFRHVLGGSEIGQNKAQAMSVHLQKRLPGIKVSAFKGSLLGWEKQLAPEIIDGVILALGDPSVERAFAKRWRQSPYSRFAVVSWLEALGLGGHSFLFSKARQGCLECLYRSSEGQVSLMARTSFLEPNQRVSRNLTGCGGAFTPFSALDAVKTAEQAVDLSLRALTGGTTLAYLSWKGDDAAALTKNILTSNWYQQAPRVFEAVEVDNLFSCSCPVCGNIPA